MVESKKRQTNNPHPTNKSPNWNKNPKETSRKIQSVLGGRVKTKRRMIGLLKCFCSWECQGLENNTVAHHLLHPLLFIFCLFWETECLHSSNMDVYRDLEALSRCTWPPSLGKEIKAEIIKAEKIIITMGNIAHVPWLFDMRGWEWPGHFLPLAMKEWTLQCVCLCFTQRGDGINLLFILQLWILAVFITCWC